MQWVRLISQTNKCLVIVSLLHYGVLTRTEEKLDSTVVAYGQHIINVKFSHLLTRLCGHEPGRSHLVIQSGCYKAISHTHTDPDEWKQVSHTGSHLVISACNQHQAQIVPNHSLRPRSPSNRATTAFNRLFCLIFNPPPAPPGTSVFDLSANQNVTQIKVPGTSWVRDTFSICLTKKQTGQKVCGSWLVFWESLSDLGCAPILTSDGAETLQKCF